MEKTQTDVDLYALISALNKIGKPRGWRVDFGPDPSGWRVWAVEIDEKTKEPNVRSSIVLDASNGTVLMRVITKKNTTVPRIAHTVLELLPFKSTSRAIAWMKKNL